MSVTFPTMDTRFWSAGVACLVEALRLLVGFPSPEYKIIIFLLGIWLGHSQSQFCNGGSAMVGSFGSAHCATCRVFAETGHRGRNDRHVYLRYESFPYLVFSAGPVREAIERFVTARG